MTVDHNNLKEFYKQLESLIVPLYLKYKDQFSSDDIEGYEEMFSQGEYELAMTSLLSSFKKKSIQLDETNEDTVNQIYKLMEIERPAIE